MLLSIIIPSKNEETNIERCLESIVSGNPFGGQSEIIVVDCASKDATIAVAGRYPVKIIQLGADWPHSPAAARFIGTRFASGDFIFFIDADMTVDPGFIPQAMEVIKNDRQIAGVGGIGNEIYARGGVKVGGRGNLYRCKKTSAPVSFLGGAGIYRTCALRQAGGFNPYLLAAEERELAQRLRSLGLKLISLPVAMITHYTAPLDTWEEFSRKRKAGFYRGIGQAVRACRGIGFLAETLAYYSQFTLFLGYLVFCTASVLCALTILIPLPVAVIWAVLLIKKRSVTAACVTLLKWPAMSLDILTGIFTGSREPATYPTQPVVIKGDFHV